MAAYHINVRVGYFISQEPKSQTFIQQKSPIFFGLFIILNATTKSYLKHAFSLTHLH